jgi:diaminopimelate decarboxylase
MGDRVFTYHGDHLHCEDVPLAMVAAAVGTPTYVYSANRMRQNYASLRSAFANVAHSIHYAVKTNSNLAVLGTLARAGAGFDIVSTGELTRLQHLGVSGDRIVFAGVGKTAGELAAALQAGVQLINVESWAEIELLSRIATDLGRIARIALRVNPDVRAGGHRYVSTGTAADKFGIPRAEAASIYARASRLPGLQPCGLHCHLGSQILEVGVYENMARQLAALVTELRSSGEIVECVNLGGGLGIRYRDEVPPSPDQLAAAVLPCFAGFALHLRIEPGRFLVGNAGVLLACVIRRKATPSKTFLIVDAAMNDLVRPSLYGAYHEILPLQQRSDRSLEPVDVVGPVCESGDFLAHDRELARLEAGEWIAIGGAGAYGFVMSSNYNSRPRAAEVLVDGDAYQVVRRRETSSDLMRGESDWTGAHRLSDVSTRA